MPGINSTVITHHLSIQYGYKPIKWKKRSLGAERQWDAEEEVDKLLEAGFIQEITYP